MFWIQLSFLSFNGFECDLSLNEIAGRVGRSRSWVTTNIGRLKNLGWTDRNTSGNLVLKTPSYAMKELEKYIDNDRKIESKKYRKNARPGNANSTQNEAKEGYTISDQYAISDQQTDDKGSQIAYQSGHASRTRGVTDRVLNWYTISDQYYIEYIRELSKRTNLESVATLASCNSSLQNERDEKNSKKRKKKERDPYPEDHFYYQCSKAFFERMKSLGKLSSVHTKDPEKTIQSWAYNGFRKLHETRKVSEERIVAICNWLFTDLRWINEGYLSAPTSLPEKTRKGDQYTFEAIEKQIEKDASTKANKFSAEELYRETAEQLEAMEL